MNGMETLYLDQVLDYCDEPLLFVARDAYDTMYLCMVSDEDSRYLGIKISNARLTQLLANEVDLREAIIHNEEPEVYYTVLSQGEGLSKALAPFRQVPEAWLPDAGYRFDVQVKDSYTVTVPRSDRRLFRNLVKRFGWAAM